MEQNNINSETGNNLSNLDPQVNNSNSESQISLESMTDEELIKLYIENKYSLSKIDKIFNLKKSHSERLFRKRNIDYNKILQEHKQDIKSNYDKNPNKCQHCGKELDWEHRNNKYCSSSCATSENNKGVVRNPNGNPENLFKYNKEKIINRKDKQVTTKENVKIPYISKESRLEKRKADYFNNMVNTTYSKYGLVNHINPGCCPICGEYHCKDEFCKTHTFKLLLNLVKHFKFNATVISTKDVKTEFNRIREMVYRLYWEEGLSTVDLGIKFNYSENRIPTNIIKFLDIPLRNRSEAGQNVVASGKSNLFTMNNIRSIFKQELHITWKGERVYLRSSYETQYANKLDELKINYLVESLKIEYFDTLLNKTRIAIPDFYLPDTNEIVEIKSDFTLDIQEMLDKFEAYKNLGYIPKLILEHKEVSLYNIENEISKDRIDKIKTGNIKQILLTKNAKTP